MKVPLALILGFLFIGSEVLLVLRRHSSKVTGGEAIDSGTIRVLWLIALSSVTAGFALAIFSIGPRLPIAFPWQSASLAIFGLGTAIRWWAIIHLGRFFTVDIAVHGDHRIIEDGPYRYVRHPSYTGLLVEFVGWALSLNSVLAVPVVVVPIILALVHRIRNEEAALRRALGAEYGSYSLRTKRLVPWIY